MCLHTPFSVHYTQPNCTFALSNILIEKSIPYLQQQIIVICIGTDRCIGDAIGPFVGSQLLQRNLHRLHVYGTLENPIHACNLENCMTSIQQQYHEKPFIIALDASLGEVSHIGNIQVSDGPVYPGTALFKKLPPVGDIHITATVNQLTNNRFEVLQNTRLHFVTCLSQVISRALLYFDRHLSYQKL